MALYTTYTDGDLIALLRTGDEKAFTEIYDRYWDKLLIVAANRLGNETEAQEIVQEVFYRFWKNHTSLTLTHSLSTYLSSAVKYEILNLFRTKNKHRLYQQHISREHLHPVSDDTQQLIDYHSRINELSALVKALPEKCRLVYQLSREQHYSQKEIASQLGISEKTVESHLSNAIRKLRTGLSIFLLLLVLAIIWFI